MTPGKSIRLYLVDGNPGGLLTAEIVNWTGHIMAAPRSDLAQLLQRTEASRTGIYVLLGDDPDSVGGTQAYIGEGDDVRTRLKAHAKADELGGKDFWDRAIVVTSKDTNLTKAHARYLESRLISLAIEAKRSTLANGTAPPTLPLPEADVSDMESFIDQVQIVLPVLGVNIFRLSRAGVARPPLSSSPAALPEGLDRSVSPVFELRVPLHGLEARAQEIDGEFTVLAGSLARIGWPASSYNAGYKALKEKLESDGTLEPIPDGSKNVFTHDQVFASPSAAGAVIVGHAANGRRKWQIAGSGISYGEWQTQGVDLDGDPLGTTDDSSSKAPLAL